MRNVLRFASLLMALLAGAAWPAGNGVTLKTGVRFEFTDCASGGSSAQTVTAGKYLLRVTTEDVFMCFAATCASNGEKLPAGLVMLLQVETSTSVSCRSAASTGDLILTRGD